MNNLAAALLEGDFKGVGGTKRRAKAFASSKHSGHYSTILKFLANEGYRSGPKVY
jgi:hypothetical protein